MQPLTHQVWAEHFAQLRPYILKEFPQVDQSDLEVERGDWAGLVALVQRSTRLGADEVERRLRALDVDELGLGSGNEPPEEVDLAEGPATVDQLRLGSGFTEGERDRILERFRKLDKRLRRFPADAVDMELSIKERDGSSQTVVFECWLPGFSPIVARSTESDLRAALMDVREDMWRQIDDAVNRRKETVR